MKLWRYGRAIEYLGQRYRLEGILGSGGMAEVYLAWDEQEQREVAIKVLRSDDLDQETLNRFMKEAGQIVAWQHPHILRVYEQMQVELIDVAQGSMLFYMVMEYASGGDLHKRLTPGKPFPLSASFALFRQLCDAVQYAHEHGVIHRDLKPLNILFRRPALGPEEVVLSDFGLAVQADASHHTFARAGTLAYMAPEQLQGHALPASDIFALGVILYQLCTGRLPFRRSIQDLARVDELPTPTRPSLLHPELPPGLDEPVLHALHELPTERYRSAREFWDTIHLTLLSNARTFPFLADETWSQAGATWPFEDLERPGGTKQRGRPSTQPAASALDAVSRPIEEGPKSPPGSLREKQKASPERSFGLSLPAYSIPRPPNQLRQFAGEQAQARPPQPEERERDQHPYPEAALPQFQRGSPVPNLDDEPPASSLRRMGQTVSERDAATLDTDPATTLHENESLHTWMRHDEVDPATTRHDDDDKPASIPSTRVRRDGTEPASRSSTRAGESSRHSTRSPEHSRRSAPSTRVPGRTETTRRSILHPSGNGLSGSTQHLTPNAPAERQVARARRSEQRPPESGQAEPTWHLDSYPADHTYADARRVEQSYTDARERRTQEQHTQEQHTQERRTQEQHTRERRTQEQHTRERRTRGAPLHARGGEVSSGEARERRTRGAPLHARGGEVSSGGVPHATRVLPVGGSLSASQKLEASGAPLRRRIALPLLQIRHRRGLRTRKWPLVPLALALALLLLVGAIFLAAGAQGSLLHLFGAPTVRVTLTPQARLEQASYTFTAIPGATTDSARRQVAARLLNSTSPTQSTTANATGSIPATTARGQLTFINNTANTITVQTTTITDNNGIQFSFNGPVTVPANPPTVTVAGFAVNPGINGNIPTLDIDKACCAPGGAIFVKNTAFTGGQDAVHNGVIQQSDIDGVARGLAGTLTQGAQADLARQVRSGERVVAGSVACQPQTSANQQAGDQAKSVTVQVAVTCGEEVYDDAAVRQLAGDMLNARVASDSTLGAAYHLNGPLTVNVLGASAIDGTRNVALNVQARGTWAYAFSPARLRQLASLIAGKSEADARALLLQQAGIMDVQFRPEGNLPGNVDEIEMRVG